MASSDSGGGSDERALRADAARNVEEVLSSAPAVLASDPTASMEAIAEQAGIARATLYRHFETREELIGAIYERALRETLAQIEAAEPTEGPPAEALRRVVAKVLGVGDRYRFLAVDHPDTPDLRLVEEEVGGPLIDLFERGQKHSAFREDLPPRLIAAFFGGVVQASVRIVDDGHLSLEQATELSLTMLIDGIGPGPR